MERARSAGVAAKAGSHVLGAAQTHGADGDIASGRHRPGCVACPQLGGALGGHAVAHGWSRGQGPDAGAHAEGDRGPHRILGGLVAPLRSALGQRPEAKEPFGRYVLTTFVKGTNMGPYEAAKHIPGVSGHELSYVANRHFSIALLNEAVADLVAASPPRDCFVQDVRIHWTVISTAPTLASSPSTPLLVCPSRRGASASRWTPIQPVVRTTHLRKINLNCPHKERSRFRLGAPAGFRSDA
ncbi:Tn3 family transposase [Streptomyces sp. NPDC056549]|uniref:Tn3 family transposase n=1 Tax=Streptomyces sp. NPDC056549 TaxID=3345864 RepID=UPI0036AA6434